VNRQCNVTKRIQTSKGPRYCPAVLSANGRIKPDVVLVGDREERHPEGAYYISWYEGKRLIRLSVGNDATTATARRSRRRSQQHEIETECQ
jgi:integrase/recombinase XerD